MAYTAIITGSVGRLIDASDMNTYIRDNVIAVNAHAHRDFPIGGIAIWPRDILDLPSNWQLCDGTNGTRNLRDKFIIGAGTTYAVGDTGGAAVTAPTGHSAHGVTQPSAHSDHVASDNGQHWLIGYYNSGPHVTFHHVTTEAGEWKHTSSGLNHSAHSGFAVDAHSAHALDGDTTPTILPTYKAYYYVQKMSEGGAYSAPHTWSDGDVPTASQLNTELKSNIEYQADREIPLDMVVGYHGSIAGIPTGFALCNGVGGRPDLMDAFVVGAGTTYALDEAGGELAIEYDTHTAHSITQPSAHSAHSWTIASHRNGSSELVGAVGGFPTTYIADSNAHSGQSLGNAGEHAHTSANATSGHSHAAFSILPPYYALAFIISTKTYTTPKTWVDTEIFSAPEWNTYVRDNIEALHFNTTNILHIAIWSGSIASIPAGWGNCNNSGGRLDLRNLFPIGAGLTYVVAATGGAVSGVVTAHGSHSMTQPSTHGAHAVTAPTNTHSPTTNASYQTESGDFHETISYGGHALSGWTVSAHSSHSGANLDVHSAHSSVATLPPYTALAYMERDT